MTRAIPMKHVLVLALLGALPALAGDLTMSGTVLGAPFSMRSSGTRFAGAIDSLIWNGMQFIDASDKGRLLQSAESFDGLGECYNPTEGGGVYDGTSPTTSSKLYSASLIGNQLQTTSQMAHWLAPGQYYYGSYCGDTTFTTAQNRVTLSDYFHRKTVTLGFQGIPNVLKYDVRFYVPRAHSRATFEVLTGYMPSAFSVFYTYNASTQSLQPLSDGPGENPAPVVLATTNGQYAMGVFSPDLPQSSYPDAGFGRFRFPSVTKWNCVHRVTTVSPGTYLYTCFVVFGTLENVRQAMAQLVQYFQPLAKPVYASFSPHPAAKAAYVFFDTQGNQYVTDDYMEGALGGYQYGKPAGFFFPSNPYPSYNNVIRRCQQLANSRDRYLSMDPQCEGQTFLKHMGYFYPGPLSGHTAVYRFYNAPLGSHFFTVNPAEGSSYQAEGILGYAPVFDF